jgi:hypothetical protein
MIRRKRSWFVKHAKSMQRTIFHHSTCGEVSEDIHKEANTAAYIGFITSREHVYVITV